MLDQRDVFQLGRDADCKNYVGNWCAADDRLDFGLAHDDTHSILLSFVVAAEQNAMSFFGVKDQKCLTA